MSMLLKPFTSEPLTLYDMKVSCQPEFRIFRTHNAGGTPYKFPKDLFVKFVTVRTSLSKFEIHTIFVTSPHERFQENNGYFPVVIETLPEVSGQMRNSSKI
jgi:hypothetical protein